MNKQCFKFEMLRFVYFEGSDDEMKKHFKNEMQ
jgi:hypothetical protein